MVDTSEHSHDKHRNRSIRMAVSTALLSKVGSIFLQLLSIPIAIRVLGRAEFGLYTTVTTALATISMLEIGVGPALTHGLSRARAGDDSATQRELVSTAFFMMLGIAVLAGLALSALLLFIPIPVVFGDSFAGMESSLATQLA